MLSIDVISPTMILLDGTLSLSCSFFKAGGATARGSIIIHHFKSFKLYMNINEDTV